MKLEKTFMKPKLATFLKYLILQVVAFWVLGNLFYIFTSPDSFELKFYGWWTNLILLPVGVAIGLTFGTRKFQLVITDSNDLEKVREWTLEFLSKDGLNIKDKTQNVTTLESQKSYNRLFNNWFGTEVISVWQKDNKVIIGGPFRVVDRLANSVDTKLRFGKNLD